MNLDVQPVLVSTLFFQVQNQLDDLELGKLYVAKKDYPKALEAFGRYIEKNPKLAEEKIVEMKNIVGKIIARSKNKEILTTAHILLADLHIKSGAVTKAINEYEKAARLAPKNGLPALKLGYVYEYITEYDKAINYYQRVVNIYAAYKGEKNKEYAKIAREGIDRIIRLLEKTQRDLEKR